MDTENPYSATGDGVTENIGKVGYFVEYVRADNNSHKWVWVDMDAFGSTIGDVCLPTANHQQAVTKLHVKSNHNGIEDVAADDDTVSGWIEFSPYNYAGNESGVNGAPTAHGGSGKTMLDWNDTLSESGSYGCMQVFRKAPTTRDNRPAQLLFAYNNWNDSDVKKAEFGIGNFAQHFWGGAQTLDYTNTKDMEKMNAGAYSVKRIEIWTKEGTYEGPDPVAVWVAGEFGDDKSAHGGLEFALNGNTTNSLGQIVIGDSTTLGATVEIPSGHSKASVLVKYSIPKGTHADDSALASMFSAYDLGALSDSGESTAKGYWYDTRNNANKVTDGSFAFASPAPNIPQEGYLLLSYKNDSETAVYLGATTSTLVGGAKSGLHFSNNDVTKIAVGGPTVAGAKPWDGMVIDSVAIFLDKYLSNSDIAFYEFPEKTTSTENGAYPVPYSWFSIYAPGITDDYVEQFAKMGASNNQNTWWQCYVLGLDPTNAMSKFVTTIRMEGQKPVVEYSPTNEVLKASKAIEYVLQGKPALTNGWQDVEFDEPGDTNRFFRVKVEW